MCHEWGGLYCYDNHTDSQMKITLSTDMIDIMPYLV